LIIDFNNDDITSNFDEIFTNQSIEINENLNEQDTKLIEKNKKNFENLLLIPLLILRKI
jgi:hypothetical protein